MNTKNTREKHQDYFGLYNTIHKIKKIFQYRVLVNSNTKT